MCTVVNCKNQYMMKYKCCINISVNNTKMSMYQNRCMINFSVNGSSQNMLTHSVLSFLFFSLGFIQKRFAVCYVLFIVFVL